jgi:hypothetical protein
VFDTPRARPSTRLVCPQSGHRTAGSEPAEDWHWHRRNVCGALTCAGSDRAPAWAAPSSRLPGGGTAAPRSGTARAPRPSRGSPARTRSAACRPRRARWRYPIALRAGAAAAGSGRAEGKADAFFGRHLAAPLTGDVYRAYAAWSAASATNGISRGLLSRLRKERGPGEACSRPSLNPASQQVPSRRAQCSYGILGTILLIIVVIILLRVLGVL